MSASATAGESEDKNDLILAKLLKLNRIEDLLPRSVLYNNIIISGGTSTGNTTFTYAMIQAIPHEERLNAVEEARELDLTYHESRAFNCLTRWSRSLESYYVRFELKPVCVCVQSASSLVSCVALKHSVICAQSIPVTPDRFQHCTLILQKWRWSS